MTFIVDKNRINVLDKGFVFLDNFMGDADLSVVNAARVSFGKQKAEMDEKDRGLIGFLMRERHGTPFEHNAFKFHVKAPIFVTREWMRHRIGSFNEYSMRYSEAIKDFYIPEIQDVRKQTGKPGHYSFEPVDTKTAKAFQKILERFYADAFGTYTHVSNGTEKFEGMGIAKELARLVLPVGIYTEFYWTVNARSLMNFISLRGAETAQLEIRRYAEAVEKFFEQKMPVTYKAFIDNGRVAP